MYPAHDYKGETVSTIGEEAAHNPRLQVSSIEEYVDVMNGLNLAHPKMIDVAVPANRQIGAQQEDDEDTSWAMTPRGCDDPDRQARHVASRSPGGRRADTGWCDPQLRPRALQGPSTTSSGPGGMLRYETAQGGKRIVFYCAFGERSTLAVKTAQEAGLDNVCHVVGGIDAWASAGGTLER